MLCANVLTKSFTVEMKNSSGETATIKVAAETEERARLLCEVKGWEIVSISKED